MLITVPASSQGLKLYATATLPATAKGFTCELDVALEGPAPGYIGSVLYVELGNGLTVLLNKELSVSNGSKIGGGAFMVPGSRWSHIGLTVDVRKDKVTASLEDMAASSPLGGATSVTPTIHFGTLYPVAAMRGASRRHAWRQSPPCVAPVAAMRG